MEHRGRETIRSWNQGLGLPCVYQSVYFAFPQRIFACLMTQKAKSLFLHMIHFYNMHKFSFNYGSSVLLNGVQLVGLGLHVSSSNSPSRDNTPKKAFIIFNRACQFFYYCNKTKLKRGIKIIPADQHITADCRNKQTKKDCAAN